MRINRIDSPVFKGASYPPVKIAGKWGKNTLPGGEEPVFRNIIRKSGIFQYPF
jgi:hypothetical protein